MKQARIPAAAAVAVAAGQPVSVRVYLNSYRGGR
jgi:hypothetical protein